MLAAITVVVAAIGAEPVALLSSGPGVTVLREGGAFWTPRLEAIRRGTLDANRHQCEITGRLSNFDKAARKLKGDATPGEFEGLLFNDSDVYKMMEGWAWVVAAEPDSARRAALDGELDALIERIGRAQLPDGYINTYYTLKVGLDRRFMREESDHETYCLGHLIEAGVGHAEALGKRQLLGIAVKAADYLDRLYADTEKGFSAPPGHQEVELALVRLGEFTGETKYVRLAKKLVDLRGKEHRKADGTMYGPWGDYAQDHLPAAQQREAAGHAVRAGYFYSAMADLARLGHEEYRPAVTALWTDITQRRVFVTGGIGPSGHNEGFTVPYDIPTRGAYQETCASIALCLYAQRMFELTGEASYMEQFERTLYNAALAGVSLSGDRFFYVNPMECTPGPAGRGASQRVAWFGCACCPPNVLRFFGQLGRYAYVVRDDVVYVNLAVGGEATVAVPGGGGGGLRVVQKTDYPWSGAVEGTFRNTSPMPVTVAVRRGGVYERLTVAAGEERTHRWEMPLPVTRVFADARVKATLGKVAIVRGPMVYAAESVDTSGPLGAVYLPSNAEIVESVGEDGTPVLRAKAMRASRGVSGKELYEAVAGGAEPVVLTLRPYFMWANRGPSEMRMWLPESPQFVDRMPVISAKMAGVKASVSFHGHGEGPEAAFDGQVSETSADMEIPRLTFWPHKGKAGGQEGDGRAEWIEYRFETAREMNGVSVFWFDDTGVGECRVPASCVAEYLEGNQWKPVPSRQNGEPGAVGVAKDQMNTIGFDTIKSTAIRLRVTLREGFSAGVLEWSVAGL